MDMTGKQGHGWRVTPDLAFGGLNSFTTTWMAERIGWAGFQYASLAFFKVDNPPPLWIRDMSRQKGGPTSGHKSHQTGLDVDMRLPLLPPKTGDWDKLGPSTYTKYFHFDAAVCQLEAIKARMDARFVFFNDPRCIAKRLSTHEPNHGNHYHIRIKPPARVDGVYM